MDMQKTTLVEVTKSDLDQTGSMPPSRLIQLLVLEAMYRNREEGGGQGALRNAFGAAWMFRRVLVRQELPVREGDVLQGYASGRTVTTKTYVVRGEFHRDGALVARCDVVMIPVNLRKRLKLKAAEIEPLYTTQPTNEVALYPRLEIVDPFAYPTEKQITPADCDTNAAHFGSHKYADLICRETGYWDGAPHTMREMQIDYVKECMPGDSIRLGALLQDGGYTVQGIHADGRPCFNARFVYE